MKAYMGEEAFYLHPPGQFLLLASSNMDGWNQLHDHQQRHDHFYRLASSSASSTEENMSISPSMIGTNGSSSAVDYHQHGFNASSSTTASHKFLEHPLENHQWSQILQCIEIDKPLRGIQQVESENFLGSLSYNHQANTAYDHHQMIECPRNYYDEKHFVPFTGSDRAGSQKGIVNSGYKSTSKPFIYFSETSNMTSIDLTDPLFMGNKQEAQLSAKGGGIEEPVYNYYRKKKKCDVPRDSHARKSKQECPKASLKNKAQINAPKAKLGDRISALQRIVSPFGKTDTASVLFEAFGYINFQQEQVKLLISPYLSSKDGTRGDMKLSNLGLCLVPISCTPQIYEENKGYSTPQHRGYSYQ